MEHNKIYCLRLTIRGTDDEQEIFFSNEDKSSEVLKVTANAEETFPAIEEKLATASIGETYTVTLPPEEAFGNYNEEFLQKLPLPSIPVDLRTVGMRISAEAENLEAIEGVIVKLQEQYALVDFNHPLAGKSVAVKFTLVAIE